VLSRAELEALPDFVAAQYMPPPGGWTPDAGYIFPGPSLWPQAPASMAEAVPTADQADQPAPEVSIGKGATVFDRDGDDLGVVDEVRLDPATGELEGIVVRVGGVLATLFGGGETVDIAAADIQRLDMDQVVVRLDKDELRPPSR